MFKLLFLAAGLLSISSLTLAQQAPQPGKPALVMQASRVVNRQLAAGAYPTSMLGGQRGRFSEQRTIVENLQAVGGYAMLVLSAERAVLIQTLQRSGPHTVFAPSDAAFNRLPGGLANLWKPAAQAQLHALIAAHIVPGSLREADLTDGRRLLTLAGTPLTVRRIGGRVALEDSYGKRAFIELSDLTASNGVVHSLDQVLAQP